MNTVATDRTFLDTFDLSTLALSAASPGFGVWSTSNPGQTALLDLLGCHDVVPGGSDKEESKDEQGRDSHKVLYIAGLTLASSHKRSTL